MDYRIDIPPSHWSLNKLEWTLYSNSRNAEEVINKDMLEFSQYVSEMNRLWLAQDCRHYLVEPSLIPLFRATSFDKLDVVNLKWPFKCFLLVLPKKEEVTSILMAKGPTKFWFLLQHKEGFTNWLSTDSSELNTAINTEHEAEIINPLTGKYQKSQEAAISYMNKSGMNDYIKLACSCLAFMNAKPDHIWQDPSAIRYPKKHKKDQRPWLPPKWLGKAYESKSQSKSQPREEPRYHVSAHWRRGHWRSQHYGPRAENLTKIIWIEPVFIGV